MIVFAAAIHLNANDQRVIDSGFNFRLPVVLCKVFSHFKI